MTVNSLHFPKGFRRVFSEPQGTKDIVSTRGTLVFSFNSNHSLRCMASPTAEVEIRYEAATLQHQWHYLISKLYQIWINGFQFKLAVERQIELCVLGWVSPPVRQPCVFTCPADPEWNQLSCSTKPQGRGITPTVVRVGPGPWRWGEGAGPSVYSMVSRVREGLTSPDLERAGPEACLGCLPRASPADTLSRIPKIFKIKKSAAPV